VNTKVIQMTSRRRLVAVPKVAAQLRKALAKMKRTATMTNRVLAKKGAPVEKKAMTTMKVPLRMIDPHHLSEG